jgi:hypothetical protein
MKIDNCDDIAAAEPMLRNIAGSPQDESVRKADMSPESFPGVKFESHGLLPLRG